ncbi:long-chain-fatty-acid--CoA ligase [Halolamina pelagica]|uniref:Long-chain-fatty-acid--CoA ligase n=1 Tax=Halolamina pelagica TaxID=699431 RepID=A0A0P7HF56_9EURY|nr:long-chain-fatty-acid--CoA ligase [Halolamina pelagica]KPN32343.1 long-chain-fatty-acid--CoA ligase [Halolamina pelagica]
MTGYQQTLKPFLWRAENITPEREIVARTHEGTKRYSYDEYGDRVGQLANALDEAGVETGDRVGTVCWNTDRHFETYFSVPNMGPSSTRSTRCCPTATSSTSSTTPKTR